MAPVPVFPCPNCHATLSRGLEELSRISHVDYHRCAECGHVWTTDKATGALLDHVTNLPRDRPQDQRPEH